MTAILRPSPAPPPARPWPDPPLRLIQGGRSARRSAAVFRRRRLLAALLALALVVALVPAVRLALVSFAPDVPEAHATPPASAALRGGSGLTVIVAPGDTLWTIARRISPRGDVRSMVDRLAAAHGTGSLHPGEQLSVPR